MEWEEREKIAGAVAALKDTAERIRELEAQAHEALFSRDDVEAHHQKLEEKTMLLMELPETVEPYLKGITGQAGIEIRKGADGFARRATQAWELASLFYMSALLYPEDYRDGDKNDLERFIDRIRSRYAS